MLTLQGSHEDAGHRERDADERVARLGAVLRLRLLAHHARRADEGRGDGDDEDAEPLRLAQAVEQDEVLHHGDEADGAAAEELPHRRVNREQPGRHERGRAQVEDRRDGEEQVRLQRDRRLERQLRGLLRVGLRLVPAVGLHDEVGGQRERHAEEHHHGEEQW